MTIGYREQDRLARNDLDQSARDIARFLGAHTGVAFVGSTVLTEDVRRQFNRYGDAKFCFVNPKGGDAVEGIPVYTSILDLPDEFDMAVIRIASKRAVQAIEDCGRRGIRNVLIFSDGFGETGAEGLALEKSLAEVARAAGVRILGPNTNDNAFERYPRHPNHRGGGIAMITQSGANGRSAVEGVAMGACFERWVTTGNEVDLEVADFINYFVHQPEVAVIALYVEGFKSAAKLRVALEHALAARKPIIAIKVGSTERGAKVAASHTGHLVGANAVVDGLFAQYGVIRVEDLDELLETANLFSKIPPSVGTGCAMYTISGGTAALMAEISEAHGVPAPVLAPATQERLHQHIPQTLSVANPIDNGGVFIIRAPQTERIKVLEHIASDPAIDMLVVGLNAAYGPLSDRMASDVLAWAPTAATPVVIVWASVVVDTPGYADAVASGVSIFRSFRKCMHALGARASYLAHANAYTPAAPEFDELTEAQMRALDQPGVLPAADAAALLTDSHIHLPREIVAASAEATAQAAAEIGFPVVLKLSSPDVPHKSDLGFVRVGIENAEEAASVAADFLARANTLSPPIRIDGVLVQEQVGAGVEMILGLSHDEQLGPALTIGAGGVFAEALRDVQVVPLPVREADVRRMIASLRLAPLLAGFRGARPANVDALVQLAMRVAALGLAAGPRLAELDLNPVIVQPHRAIPVDCLVIGRGTAEPA